jgi:diguanylate cyclase (GGDEF)-like protein
MTEKILLVDDDPNILRGYHRSLRKRFRFHIACGAEEALKVIEQNGPFAVVVSDMRMPGMDGLQLLSSLKEIYPHTVRIMLTGNADQKTAMNAVNKGQVLKFLTKPCSPETLASAIETGLSQYNRTLEKHAVLEQSAAEVRDLSERLCIQAHHDILTGLHNRQAFELQLQAFFETAQNGIKEHALCHFDLDHFHIINETCGHFAGDELLRQISNLFSSKLRSGDLLARLAGDEFGMLLADCSLNEAKGIIQRLHDILKQYRFEWEGKEYEVGVSIGLVPLNAETGSVTAALSTVETACHVAMDQGYNRLQIGTVQDKELTHRLNKAQWANRVNQALKENRFRLYFQPIIPIEESNEGEHYEILVRMLDERGEVIPPSKFLAAAEHYCISPQLDRWVIKHTAEWLALNTDTRQRLSTCSINLSGRSLGDDEVLRFITQIFDKFPIIEPERICFEVTETAAITHLYRAIGFIKALKRKGFRFALDDFGSGFSSFAYLKNLPVDFLKIDGMFVKQMRTNPIDRAMVKSINEIGKLMGKKTIAEFVENKAILDDLRLLKVDYAQGYYFGQARPLDVLE